MAKKYAMMWATSRPYMSGTNGILNALEYYKFKNIDPYVLLWDDLNPEDDYFKQWPDVTFKKMDLSFWPKPMDAYWYMVFAPPNFAIKLLDEYDVVLIWGADVCPLDNFEEHFEYAEKLQKLILGHNEQGLQNFSGLSEKWPYRHTWDVPWADIPLFVPKIRKDVLQLTLDYQARDECIIDWMDGLNYAIRDLNAPVMTVPGTLWVYNVTGQCKIKREVNPTTCYFMAQRMKSFHRKYWSANFCRAYMHPGNETTKHNHLVFNIIWNFFNRECRVRWTENLEVWDGN